MEEYLVAIRDWVLILLSVVMVFTGILRYLLTRSSPTPDAKMVNEGQVVIRARSLNAVANLITPKCFRHRRFYFSNESLTFAWSAWINYFFSGFVTAKIPFSLAQRFRSRLQNGIDLSTVDASYVCSRSQSVSSYTDSHLPEGILTEILARLPLRSISRFKSVCRTWKSALDSLYFRRLFVSLHQNTSSSWSLVCQQKEFMDFHGCQTWGLPKSLGSYIRNIEISGDVLFVDSSNGLVLINVFYGVSVVGNPLLQQWVVVPSPPYPYETMLSGLVTRVDEDGVILSFKVVRTAAMTPSEDRSSTCLCFCVYSSETGIWTCKRLHCPHYFTHSTQMTLHGMLYISPSGLDARAVTGALIAHDFYGESNVCRVIPLPDNDSNRDQIFKRALTTSSGFVMYIKPLAGNVLKVWRLLNHDDDDSAWQLVWETRLQFIPFDDDIHFYVPLTMHPFDHNIVYLWNIQFCYLVSCNLQTQNYNIFIDQSVDDDLQNCFVNQSVCEKTMDGIFDPNLDFHYGIHFTMFQYVLPRWMGSMPRPPQAEMLDTTSLLSYITSHITLNRKKIREKIRKNRGF